MYDRVKHILKERLQETFIVKNSDGIYRFHYEEILYFYSDRRLVKLVTLRGIYPFYEKLDALEKNGEIFCADSSEISGEWEKSNTYRSHFSGYFRTE